MTATMDVATRIRHMAIKMAWTYGRDDKHELAKDIEQSAWLGYLKSQGRPENLRMMRAHDYAMDEWCKWRFGVMSRGKKEMIRRPEPIQLSALSRAGLNDSNANL